MGAPEYPDNPIPDWEGFKRDFEDFYYQEAGRSKGSIMIIEENGEEIGCLCYACFHLNPGRAELDIWLKGQRYCGKGNGTKALIMLTEYLNSSYSIKKFIIRPSVKNERAIRAYEKAGFKKVSANKKEKTINEFVRSEYLAEYGPGDYGFAGTEVLIKNKW